MRIGGFVTGVSVAVFLTAATAGAQSRFQYVGPSECINCHDHQNQRQWYEKQEIAEVQKRFPQKSANAGHINSLKQLEAAKSNDFAKAIGLRDKYDIAGACVKCHATVFQGDANAGVSCESCHGPASGYVKPHQTKGAYAQSLPLGMVDIIGKVAAWADQCTSCHVMEDQRLIAAGHPSGDDFDLEAMFAPVSAHFVKKYSENDVRALSRERVRNIIAKRRGAPTATAAVPSPATAPPAPPAPVAVPPPISAQPSPSSLATAMPPLPAAGTSSARGTPPTTQTVRGNPSTSPRVTPSPSASVVAPASSTTTAAASSAAPPPATAAPSATAEPLPTSLSAAVALIQGRLISALTGLVSSGATVPLRSSTPAPAVIPYAGPDAALLQLQREAIALALEVLGTPPAAPRPQER